MTISPVAIRITPIWKATRSILLNSGASSMPTLAPNRTVARRMTDPIIVKKDPILLRLAIIKPAASIPNPKGINGKTVNSPTIVNVAPVLVIQKPACFLFKLLVINISPAEIKTIDIPCTKRGRGHCMITLFGVDAENQKNKNATAPITSDIPPISTLRVVSTAEETLDDL